MRIFTLVLLAGLTLVAAACAGVRHSQNTYVVHAESIRVFGFSIPESDQEAAYRVFESEVGAVDEQTLTVRSTPGDWESISGVIRNILWIHRTTITGLK